MYKITCEGEIREFPRVWSAYQWAAELVEGGFAPEICFVPHNPTYPEQRYTWEGFVAHVRDCCFDPICAW